MHEQVFSVSTPFHTHFDSWIVARLATSSSSVVDCEVDEDLKQLLGHRYHKLCLWESRYGDQSATVVGQSDSKSVGQSASR